MDKKRFKDTVVGKILIGASSLIPGVGGALSQALTGSLSPLEALNVIKDSEASPEDKHKLTELLLNADTEEAKEVTLRNRDDAMSDSWWSKNIRPLSMVFMHIVIFTLAIMDSFDFGFSVGPEWIDLYKYSYLGFISFYVGSRGLEKWKSMNT